MIPGKQGQAESPPSNRETTMKRFAASMVLASGFAVALLGGAGAAQADLSDLTWNLQQQQKVYVPHVDNSVRHSR